MVRQKSTSPIVDATEDFVKSNPLTSIIAATLLGYAIGRLIHKRHEK